MRRRILLLAASAGALVLPQRPRATKPPRSRLAGAAAAPEVVFENINVVGFAARGAAAVKAILKRRVWRKTLRAVPTDDLIAIITFMVLRDPLLRLAWRIGGSDRPFEESWANTFRPAARLLGYVFSGLYALDVVYVVAGLIGRPMPWRGADVAATAAYTAVVGVLLTSVNNRLLDGKLRDSGSGARARNFAMRRGSNVGIWALCGLVCLEVLRLEVGLTYRSIAGLAGVSGIAVGFAAKDLAANLVGGSIVFITRPFVPGDKISLTNLHESKVERIGWYGTTVRGNDELVQIVPNSKFVSNKVSNMSKRKHRYMKQSFFVRYEDLDRCEDLVALLRERLGAVATVDTGRRFFVYVKSLRETDVEIEVELHFKGVSSAMFRERRMESLLAIGDCVREVGAKFAVWDGLLSASHGAKASKMASSVLPKETSR